jgi:hypothetical protein
MASLIPAAISGLAGLFGGGKQQKTQTSGTITNNQSGNFSQQGNTSGTSSNTANLNPLQMNLANQFTRGAQNLANSAADMTGYTQQGLQGINAGAAAGTNVLNNILASRGLSFSPAAASAQTQNQLNRINQQSQFLSKIPLLQRQLQTQANQGLEQAFSTMPINTTQTSSGTTSQSGQTSQQGTQTQQGTNLVSGNPMGGLFSGLGAGLLSPSVSGNDTSNLGDILMHLFNRNNGIGQLDNSIATTPGDPYGPGTAAGYYNNPNGGG